MRWWPASTRPGRPSFPLRELKEEDLGKPVLVGSQGVEAPRAHVLHHLVEHAQHHAGQVIYARKLLGSFAPTAGE